MKTEITYIHGRKGAGKSTLARALAQLFPATSAIHELPSPNLPDFKGHVAVIVVCEQPPKPKDRQRIARVIEVG